MFCICKVRTDVLVFGIWCFRMLFGRCVVLWFWFIYVVFFVMGDLKSLGGFVCMGCLHRLVAGVFGFYGFWCGVHRGGVLWVVYTRDMFAHYAMVCVVWTVRRLIVVGCGFGGVWGFTESCVGFVV